MLGLGAMVVLIVALIAVLIIVKLGAEPPGNAIWLGVTWARDEHTDAEIRLLAERLRENEIGYAYVYTTWLHEDGTFNPTYDHATEFLNTIRSAYPELRVLSWIGVPTVLPDYRLDDESVWVTVGTFCRLAVEELGFDGVHLNVEPVRDGNPDLPSLLSEIRAQIGDDAIISLATPPDWNPGDPNVPSGPHAEVGSIWSTDYKQEIAALVDQMVVMAYNSGLDSPDDYTLWMSYQVVQFSQALYPLGAGAELIIGVPTYQEEPGHDPDAESLQAGLEGVLMGMRLAGDAADVIAGVGIYAYWDTTEEEWQTYRRLWLGIE